MILTIFKDSNQAISAEFSPPDYEIGHLHGTKGIWKKIARTANLERALAIRSIVKLVKPVIQRPKIGIVQTA